MNLKKLLKIGLLTSGYALLVFSSQQASASAWRFTESITFKLINYSSKPIFYGVAGASNLYNNPSIEQCPNGQDCTNITNITSQPGPKNVKATNKGDFINGSLVPAGSDGIPSSANLTVSGDYKHEQGSAGAGLFYALNFSWQGGFSTLFHYGTSAYSAYLKWYVTNYQTLVNTTQALVKVPPLNLGPRHCNPSMNPSEPPVCTGGTVPQHAQMPNIGTSTVEICYPADLNSGGYTFADVNAKNTALNLPTMTIAFYDIGKRPANCLTNTGLPLNPQYGSQPTTN